MAVHSLRIPSSIFLRRRRLVRAASLSTSEIISLTRCWASCLIAPIWSSALSSSALRICFKAKTDHFPLAPGQALFHACFKGSDHESDNQPQDDHRLRNSHEYDRATDQLRPLRNRTRHSCTNPGLRPRCREGRYRDCLLYTSDAADDLLCVDLGGRRI